MPPLLALPTVVLPRTDARHPLIPSLLSADNEVNLHSVLLDLRRAATASASNEDLLAFAEAACEALASVDQDVALATAARPHEERDACQALVADKRIASGEMAGDETLNPSILVPLLRRATRLSCKDPELGERLLDAIGTLIASLSGHGEHTYRIDLGAAVAGAPLLLRHVPGGQAIGVRFWPVARLLIGACAAGWAGLRIAGRTVLELGCGTGAVGIACAALGSSEVWCTDSDIDALVLAARNATANGAIGNGAAAVRVGKLDVCNELEADRPHGMPRHFGLVVAAIVDDEPEGAVSAAALRVAARHVNPADPHARVLCCFGQTRRAALRGSEASYEAAVRLGESVLHSGLRVLAKEHVPADAQSDELLMLLLAPAGQGEESSSAVESVHVPVEIDASATPTGLAPVKWVRPAAQSLLDNGLCVLRRPSLIPADLVERCRRDARPRLDRLLRLAEQARASETATAGAVAGEAANEGVGAGAAPIRFQELYSRAPWEHRFDVTVLQRLSAVMHGEPSAAMDDEPWRELLAALDALVRPVLAASGIFAGADDMSADDICVDAVGFVLSCPGAPGQMWHPDTEVRAGLVNAFVPLVPLSDANGPTALALCSHVPPRPKCPSVVYPLLCAGEVLLFDWRTWHRGCANRSSADRPVAYVTYARRGVEGASYKRAFPSLERGSARTSDVL